MNIVLVEDSVLIRTELIRLLVQQPRFRLLGWAGDEERAVELILGHEPDAVLLDLSLAPGSGLRVLERIRAAGSGTRVLILSNHVDPALQTACAALGVSGYFDKSREVEQWLARLASWLPPVTDRPATR